MIDKDTKFLIVGLGLIGGSYAMGLTRQGYHVSALDTNEDSIQFALDHQYIENGAVFDEKLIQDADVIISALYPLTMIDWISTYQEFFKSGILITDVSGVKQHIVETVQRNLRKDVEFIASHPMAGKEVSGVRNSDDHIFEIANFIITPTPNNSKRAIAFMKDFAAILNFHHITTLTPKQHDEMIGFVSQLTHVIAVSLMNTNDNTHLVEYTGDSFRDLTRIAKINENMWSELFFLNKDNLIREIEDFEKELNHLKQKLADNDEAGLKALFRQSTQRRTLFDKIDKPDQHKSNQ
ncbi:prephenate dehydrogenase/arogenate dehydrogenase family protein [Clostridiaceae bacterium DONG20-135]|uniref:Prephenate dehydrogenase/arogenate dehydrogenase family protein n=1 Tax=Copranaerobaculum intestinale TaxID=2692629 RepID=A0A6N8U5L8_9FIRM|nr:prephenate dehydrogenase [Copranaerobaculum intestinale]MXQ72614.1 prephenate dehydrogenase/arogenate dehydrogenase family protein [Copranaerobaculum intestinale]